MPTEITDYPSSIALKFSELFQQQAIIIRSPGRINLIGEHTDYNMGFVLPAAINKAIYLGIQKRADNEIHLHALDYSDDHITTTAQIERSGKLWPDYLLGVVDQINKKRAQDGRTSTTINAGFNIVFGGNIPPGAGLSSSAALECATAYALNELFNLGFDKVEMVKMAQKAENDFVGMKCGIMDQFASMFGKDDQLIRLDCRSLEYTYIPFHLGGVKVVLFNTMVKHSLASSAYNERRQQCEEGVRLVQQGLEGEALPNKVASLRDVTEEMLLNYVKPVNDLVYSRCAFVVSEIQRLLAGCTDLENNDIAAFGKKMFETHEGLSTLYEVSCKELDVLIDLVKDDPRVLGARMMGGGFGGCTINLIKDDAVDELISNISQAYKAATGVDMLTYLVEVEDGTSICLLK